MNKYTKQLDIHCYKNMPTIYNIYNGVNYIKHIDKHIDKHLSKRQLLNKLLDINKYDNKIYYRYINIRFVINYYKCNDNKIFKISNIEHKGYIKKTNDILLFINQYKLKNNHNKIVKLYDETLKYIDCKVCIDTYINNRKLKS